jgi:non-canonical poly(A) RNA polymerase PAPD5/7
LRPELKKVPNTLSARQARRHAGYETNEEMEKDLDAREKELKDQVESEEAWKMVMDDA